MGKIFLESAYHANDPLHAYVYVLCLSPTELYIHVLKHLLLG